MLFACVLVAYLLFAIDNESVEFSCSAYTKQISPPSLKLESKSAALERMKSEMDFIQKAYKDGQAAQGHLDFKDGRCHPTSSPVND